MKIKSFAHSFSFVVICLLSVVRSPAQAADPTAVQAFIDLELAANHYNPSVQGNVLPAKLLGQAKAEFQLWQTSGAVAAITAVDAPSQALWIFSVIQATQEIGGDQIPFIAVFSAVDGALIATGKLPAASGLKGFAWDLNPMVGKLPEPMPYVPALVPATSTQSADEIVKAILGEFDEEALKSKTYPATDENGAAVKIKAQVNSSGIVFTVLSKTKMLDSFSIQSSTPILKTNLDQYGQDAEGNFLVITVQAALGPSTFWLHNFEGNTTLKFQQENHLHAYYFNADH